MLKYKKELLKLLDLGGDNMDNNMFINDDKGKIAYEKSLLSYSNAITNILSAHPDIVQELTDRLEVTEDLFWKYVSREETIDITFYDAALGIAQELTAPQKEIRKPE
jgi:hypothetical protein